MTTANLLEVTRRQNLSMLERLRERLTLNLTRRALRHTFLKMDDHMLRDIGLTRHSVQSDEF